MKRGSTVMDPAIQNDYMNKSPTLKGKMLNQTVLEKSEESSAAVNSSDHGLKTAKGMLEASETNQSHSESPQQASTSQDKEGEDGDTNGGESSVGCSFSYGDDTDM